MNQSVWEDLATSVVFVELPEISQKLILEKLSIPSPVEIFNISDVSYETTTLEVVSMEASATVPMALRSPRPKPTHIRES